MSFEHIQVEQLSDEWFQSRLGKITASQFAKYIKLDGGASSQCYTTNKRLVAEIISGEPYTFEPNDAMKRGIELEPEALGKAREEIGLNFEDVGFFQSTELPLVGVSPDGIDWEANVGIEIKCPSLHTHLDYLATGKVPNQYFAQVQGQLMVSGFSRWYFYSYYPGFKSLCLEVERDEAFISNLYKILERNSKKITEKVDKLREIL